MLTHKQLLNVINNSIPAVLCLEFMIYAGLVLGLHPASERRRYKVTPYLIGSAQT